MTDLAAFLVMVCALGLLEIRNRRVLAFRLDLLRQIRQAAEVDRLQGLYDFRWRYQALHAVSYARMVHQFWRTLDSFYPDRRFTKPT